MRSKDFLSYLSGILCAQTVRRTHKLQESHLDAIDAINDAHGGIFLHKDVVFLYFPPLFQHTAYVPTQETQETFIHDRERWHPLQTSDYIHTY